MAFATVEALEKRWRPLSDEEEQRASVLLSDASLYVESQPGFNKYTNPAILELVVCNIVRRIMDQPTSIVSPGISQYSQGVGSFTESVTLSNPTGAMYLRGDEKSLLGIGAGKYGFIPGVV